MAPASARSSEARSTRSRSDGGPVTRHRATCMRIEPFASVLARRRATSTTATASMISGRASGPASDASAGPEGHGALWIEPDCHQDHASSVQ